MKYLQAQLEAKQFTIEIMLNNPNLFGGEQAVNHKVSLLRFEIIQLNKKLDAWH
jgi:hypothetical protein